jgi:hypothetical protein
MLVIPALGKIRNEEHKFEANLGYRGRPYLNPQPPKNFK